MSIPVLTIDGPSGAGKGSVSRALAKKLGWHYLDSGSIYRALAIAALQQQVAVDNEPELVRIAETMNLEFVCGDALIVKLNGDDITPLLGNEKTGNAASIISALPDVRQALLKKQQDFRQTPGLVADGRDMGTVVFPDAQVKVFLTASSDERARRRHRQLAADGIETDLAQLTSEIEMRDQRDSARKTAPLVAASNALYIDSTKMTLKDVISKILFHFQIYKMLLHIKSQTLTTEPEKALESSASFAPPQN